MTGIRLLYVDDDPALGLPVQTRLTRLGYAVHIAPHGTAGLDIIQAGLVDVVALDHPGPGFAGVQTLGAVRALPDPPPVICVTGMNESRAAVSALKAGAADVLVKNGGDFIGLLDAAVRAALTGDRLRKEKEAADREVREACDRFEALAAEREMLMREVNHRVGNSLQLVAAFLHIQANSSATPETRAALAEANRRVLAIAQVHRRLYASGEVKDIALDSYLAELIGDIRDSTDAEGVGDLLSLDAEPVTVDADSAVTIGIIVTEFVINAMKYAYPRTAGPIRVRLRAGGSARGHVLAVEDDGVGRHEDGAPSAGLGKTIIEAMASKLDATISYHHGHPGTRAVMTFSAAHTRLVGLAS